ncbi:hypothetical protein [Dapis sp. BLCC M172]|uniref:hypothetical protein n=1 Tax=Dapis sp. BLCC M172 TaxID=2975281 RepID=UPI003CFA63D1
MVFPFIIGALGLAVGAVAGTFTTHAVGEKDRQAAKYHRKIANELSEQYAELEQRYYELADKSQRQIQDLIRQKALDEVEKDCLRLALRLQQHLIYLMADIDREPSIYALQSFREAVDITNEVLCEANEELILIPSYYYARNKVRAIQQQQLINSQNQQFISSRFDIS